MYQIKIFDREFQVEFQDNNLLKGTLNGNPFEWDIQPIPGLPGHYHVLINHKSYEVFIQETRPEEKVFVLEVGNRVYEVALKDKFDLLLKNLGMDKALNNKVNEVKAPMPGLVLSVNFKPGDVLKKGDSLLVLEAMKMENVIKSPIDGKIKSINIKAGEAVEKNQVLVTFE